jgi:hypothetical protein
LTGLAGDLSDLLLDYIYSCYFGFSSDTGFFAIGFLIYFSIIFVSLMTASSTLGRMVAGDFGATFYSGTFLETMALGTTSFTYCLASLLLGSSFTSSTLATTSTFFYSGFTVTFAAALGFSSLIAGDFGVAIFSTLWTSTAASLIGLG